MNLVAKNLVIASILAAAAATASSASALPVRGETVPGDETPTTPTKSLPTRPIVTQPVAEPGDLGTTPVVLASKFQEPVVSSKVSQMSGAVQESESAGGAETVDNLGALDDAAETHTNYGVLRAAYPIAKLYTPVVASTMPIYDATPIASPVLATRAGSIFVGTTPVVCGGTPVTNFSKGWHLADDFGNSKFGGGYDASLTLTSTASSAPNMDKISAEAAVRALATIFGSNKEVAKLSAKAALQGTTGTSSISVRVMGNDIWSRSVSGNLVETKDFSRTFFSASMRIWLGPVPVKFSAAANGAVGYSYSASYVAPYATLTATPYAKVYVVATAAVDAVVASAGVTGTLTILEASVPGTAKIGIQPSYLSYDVDVDLKLKSLAGKIEAWAKVWYLFGSHKWTTTLASWDGFQATFPIVDTSGCVPLPANSILATTVGTAASVRQ